MLLDKVTLQNFKSHTNSVIEPKKITAFIGSINSGKSSFFQALLMLKTTFQTNNIQLVTDHRTYGYGNFKDIVSFGKQNIVGIGINGRNPLRNYVLNHQQLDTSFEYVAQFTEAGRNRIKLKVKVGHCGVDVTYPSESEYDTHAWDNKLGTQLEITNEDPNGINPAFTMHMNDEKSQAIFNTLFSNGRYTQKLLDNFYYIPFSRAITSYSLPIEYANNILSSNPEMTSSILLSKISSEPKLKRKISKYVSQLGGKTIDPRNVNAYTMNQFNVTLDFVRNDFSNSIINEGSGLNQIILLLAMLVDTPDKSIIAIEEPESHLDPYTQSKLVNILLEQVKNSEKQIMFTTHSEHMIYPLLAKISKKELTVDDVAIYYFTHDYENEVTSVEKLEINEHGQIKGELKGFWDVEAKIMAEILGEPDD